MASRPYRLPGHIRPESYIITLDARLARPTFTGTVAIKLAISEPTSTIELHANALDISDVELDVAGVVHAGRLEVIEDAEAIRIVMPETVPAGEATLRMAFTGHVSVSMEGLYRSKNGPEECLATQCQETDARTIFPCFDEPAFKATFQWVIATDAAHEVIANGVAETVQESADGATRTWTFAPTRAISSYLLAMAIGDFAHGEVRVVNGVPLRVLALKGKEGLGDYANDLTARLLPWFEDYFGVPYPYGKYDQLAVPSFSAGAMENVGLVVFRENLLLVDPATASWAQTKSAARVVAHEFAHMWFGNLVTMAWWDDVWLNESFAEWMAHRAMHAVEPDYHVWDDFQAGKAGALSSDALETTHSIYSPVETPQEATELFDAITYQKGSAVMRMLESFLGADAFRAGLRTYMREFSESNARGADLWRHLSRSSSQPVDRIMDAWITQKGYPVVTMRVAPDGAVTVTQRRFLVRPDATQEDTTWPIPLVIRYADDAGVHTQAALLEGARGRVALKVAGALKWVHGNADGVGFYRIDLDTTASDDVLKALATLTPAERITLLDDGWALVQNATHSVDRFLETLDAVAGDARNPNVIARLAGHARDLEGRLIDAGDEAALEKFREWVRDRLGPALTRFGLHPVAQENALDAESRAILLEVLASVGQEERARAHAITLQAKEAEDPASVPPELAGVSVRVAARFGDAAHYEGHLRTYTARREARASPQVVQRYLYTLADFRDPDLVKRAFDLMDSRVIPLEAIGPMLRGMFGARHAREAAWTYLTTHWSVVRKNLGDMWTGFLVEASGALPAERRADMVAFYDANLKGVATQAYARALERVDQQAEFDARTRDGLVAWFKARA